MERQSIRLQLLMGASSDLSVALTQTIRLEDVETEADSINWDEEPEVVRATTTTIQTENILIYQLLLTEEEWEIEEENLHC